MSGDGTGSLYVDDKEGLTAWVERFFFAGVELSVLSTPAFVVAYLAQALYPDTVPLAGLAAIGAGSIALAVYRARTVDVGGWPRRGEFSTLPLRVAHFSLVFLIACVAVGAAAGEVGSWGMAFLSGGAAEVLGLGLFPRVYRAVHGDPFRKPAERA
ncbi:hypothetical protein [Haloparvum sedimenti]|uniref:hypothetical protein n=1 Tax=Haloparvum sedimenti TaxID=1678448 RepID=UPI00071E6956|nr:hypothetical protein [Haloparvum sedimenti]